VQGPSYGPRSWHGGVRNVTNKRGTLARGALIERALLGRPKVSPAVTQLHPDTQALFKDNYLVDFPGLPEPHSEHKLQTATIAKLKNLMNTRHAEAVMPDDLFADPVRARLVLSIGILLFSTWIFAILAPPMISGTLHRPDPWLWYLMAALYSYFGYTGIRAWRRGWRSRFILRIVVPLSLFAVSSALTVSGVWRPL
jgi:hypothetical protein